MGGGGGGGGGGEGLEGRKRDIVEHYGKINESQIREIPDLPLRSHLTSLKG